MSQVIRCEDCRLRFSFGAYERHFDRRGNRCRTVEELAKLRSLVCAGGIWRRVGMLTRMPRGQSRARFSRRRGTPVSWATRAARTATLRGAQRETLFPVGGDAA